MYKGCNFFIIATWGYLFLVFLTASQLDKFQYRLYHLVVPMCDLNDTEMFVKELIWISIHCTAFSSYKKKQNRFCFIKSLYILVHMHMYGSMNLFKFLKRLSGWTIWLNLEIHCNLMWINIWYDQTKYLFLKFLNFQTLKSEFGR